MQTTIREAKQAVRNEVSARLKTTAPAQRAAASAQARALLVAQPLWGTARRVLLFAPIAGELDVWPLVAEALSLGKTVALPRFAAESGAYEACQIQDAQADLQIGRFGIREPVLHCPRLCVTQLDLILVPGVGFDMQGHRLGRGRGYYDRLLMAFTGTTCGVAFDEQMVEEVPVEPHDVRLDCILTPTRWVQPKR